MPAPDLEGLRYELAGGASDDRRPDRVDRSRVFLSRRRELQAFPDHHRPHQTPGSTEIRATVGGRVRSHAGTGATVRDCYEERIESTRHPALESPNSASLFTKRLQVVNDLRGDASP